MSCSILNTGYAIPCAELSNRVAGTFDIYIATYSASTVFTVDGTGVITGATGYNQFYKFECNPETIEPTEEREFNKTNLTGKWSQSVNGIIYDIDQTGRNLFALLTMNRNFVISKANDGNFYLFFKEKGAWANTGSIKHGKAMTDPKQIEFTFSEDCTAPAVEVSAAFITTLGL